MMHLQLYASRKITWHIGPLDRTGVNSQKQAKPNPNTIPQDLRLSTHAVICLLTYQDDWTRLYYCIDTLGSSWRIVPHHSSS